MKTSYYFDAHSYRTHLKDKVCSKQNSQNFKTVLAMFALFLGLLYGALLLKDDQVLLQQFLLIQQTTLAARIDAGFLSVFVQSLGSNLCFLLGSLICGFWAVGQPFALFLLLAKGMGIGGLVGSMYLQYGTQGVVYAAVLILPGAVCSVFALLYSTREAISLSNLLFCCLFLAGQEWNQKMIRLYLIKQSILLAFVVLAALLDGTTTVLAQNLMTI